MTTRRELLTGLLSTAAATAAGGLTIAATGSPAHAAGPLTGYVMGYFTESPNRWTSFRSHNFPDRYLRHSNYLLRIDVLDTGSPAADRADATFQVGY